jgi:two-component system, cell cycle sensor histidine kinase and response regulator CckA
VREVGEEHQFEIPSAQIPKGSETILLVEDTTEVRELIRESLEMGGYKVLAAESSLEAAHVADAHEGAIHLVLSDIVLPGVSGPVLVEQLLSKRPGMKVLFMSGYTADRIPDKVSQEGFNFIQKPFSPAALAGIVRDVLDATGRHNGDASPPGRRCG